jgi:nucleoside phosphorylase
MSNNLIKPCLIFASKIEAQDTIKSLKAHLISPLLFDSKLAYIFIAGIGGMSIMQHLFSSPLPSDHWINLGIAGQLQESLPPFSFVQIHKCRKYQPVFPTKHAEGFTAKFFPPKSFKINHSTPYPICDLMTCDFPLYDSSEKSRLQSSAGCVDMEGYYLAYAAQHLKARLHMFKLISDLATEDDQIVLHQQLKILSKKIAEQVPTLLDLSQLSP